MFWVIESHHHNPLIRDIAKMEPQVEGFQRNVRSFYFDVILSTVKCPQCAGRLRMVDQSKCQCQCGSTFDPTLSFQVSPCCGAKLLRKTSHYVCSLCGKSVPSKFIFMERIFDKDYFKEMMRTCRDRKKQQRERMRQLLAASRSDDLELTADPDLDKIPGLLIDLDEFIGSHIDSNQNYSIKLPDSFNMVRYRNHILRDLSWNPVEFSEIAPLIDNRRKDRVWRFITLIYMQNDKEIKIQQLENDLLIQRTYNETHG
ncbi:uncharacterized protein Dvar_51370 [Desulfosarcina variabilis str. Montpellier]